MRFLILGCGWIGEALAMKLLLSGHQVYATTTNNEKYQRLKAAGISAIVADFDKAIDLSSFPAEVDFVLNSVPAVKRLEWPVLTARFMNVKKLLGEITYGKHIFLSSIGVYPDQDGDFTEDTAVEPQDNKLLFAEQHMLSLPNTVVYRLGGLFGQQRIFAKYFQNKVCTTGAQLANFIHQSDVLNLIELGFREVLSASCYNLVTPTHPTKRAVILASAAAYGLDLPSRFDDEECFQKKVHADKIRNELNYSFQYPSPLDF